MMIRARAGAGDGAGGLDAVQYGHPDVHEHDVGLQLADLPDRLGPVGGFPHNSEVVLALQDERKPILSSGWSSTNKTLIGCVAHSSPLLSLSCQASSSRQPPWPSAQPPRYPHISVRAPSFPQVPARNPARLCRRLA